MPQAIAALNVLYGNDAPGEKVSNLTAPVHIEKFKFASTWKIPRALLNDNSDNKIERIHYSWIITGWLENKIMSTQYPLEEYTNWNPREEPVTESVLDLYWVKFRNGRLFYCSKFCFSSKRKRYSTFDCYRSWRCYITRLGT